MSSLTKVLKFAGVLLSVAFGVFMGIAKLIVFLFEDDNTDAPISSPGLQMGETTLGTIEPVVINDDHVIAGGLSDEPIVRYL
jgi:hypothetical protein